MVRTLRTLLSSTRASCTSAAVQTRCAGAGPTQAGSKSVDTVTVKYRGKSFEVRKGAKLRTALLKNGATPHNEGAVYINCRGIGSCGTCAVEICGGQAGGNDDPDAPPVLPREWTTAERLRLNFPPHSPPGNQKLRLACQVRVNQDITVIKRDKFWGEGDSIREDIAEAASASSLQPLGSLEFVLDREADAVVTPNPPPQG
mmetsp:Transcript_8021/g.16419  ORF Transcript_8021/g.16419 Transcript_8021/m.16419 type:complete len:201 (+) Transcript_8021:98-700(+)